LAQTQQRAAASLPFYVEDDPALVAVHLQVQVPHAAPVHGRGAPHDVAFRRLDLDYFGAVVREDLRRVGTHDDGGQVDDADALQRARSGHPAQYPAAQPSVRGSEPPCSAPVAASMRMPWYPPPLRSTHAAR